MDPIQGQADPIPVVNEEALSTDSKQEGDLEWKQFIEKELGKLEIQEDDEGGESSEKTSSAETQFNLSSIIEQIPMEKLIGSVIRIVNKKLDPKKAEAEKEEMKKAEAEKEEMKKAEAEREAMKKAEAEKEEREKEKIRKAEAEKEQREKEKMRKAEKEREEREKEEKKKAEKREAREKEEKKREEIKKADKKREERDKQGKKKEETKKTEPEKEKREKGQRVVDKKYIAETLRHVLKDQYKNINVYGSSDDNDKDGDVKATELKDIVRKLDRLNKLKAKNDLDLILKKLNRK
jgi:hypothetical protein